MGPLLSAQILNVDVNLLLNIFFLMSFTGNPAYWK